MGDYSKEFNSCFIKLENYIHSFALEQHIKLGIDKQLAAYIATEAGYSLSLPFDNLLLQEKL